MFLTPVLGAPTLSFGTRNALGAQTYMQQNAPTQK